MRRWFIAIAGVSTLFGLYWAAMALAAAWEHNPQGGYHGDGYVDWASLVLIGVTWFVVAAVPTMTVLTAVWGVVSAGLRLRR